MVDTFIYRLLSRCKSDCLYFIKTSKAEKFLYFGSVEKHIAEMKRIYLNIPSEFRPEWLTLEEIENYHQQMTAK